jgi:hypothetical protein
MKKAFLFCFLFSWMFVSSQKEGQSFCDGDKYGEYFPLNVYKKKIYWYGTYYFETNKGVKNRNDKKYIEFVQEWENGEKSTIYFRFEKNEVLMFEECCEKETLRFSNDMKVNDEWSNVEKDITYKIISFSESLSTPICKYSNLLVIRAIYQDITFDFYYLKGFGYVGATKDEKLISYATPEF